MNRPRSSPNTVLRTQRDMAERLLDIAEHLSTSDAALIRAVYDRGMTATAFAKAARQQPRSLRLRLQRLVARITTPNFLRILALHRRWPPFRREVARAIFLRNESQRRAAARLGVSIHRIRRECDCIRALAEEQDYAAHH